MKEIKLTKQMLRGGMQDRNRRREICKFNSRLEKFNKIIEEPVVKHSMSFGVSDSKLVREEEPRLNKTRSKFGWNDYE